MYLNKTLSRALVMLSFISIGAMTNPAAQAQQINPDGKFEDTESRAQVWAIETGEIAGGANFCKIDPEIIENYITRAQARIASEARSEVELVVARISFSNTMNTSSINEPTGGCEDFNDRFEKENVRLD